MNTTILFVGLMLALKHFLADGPLQTPYQYLNKGKFGHPGGTYHALIHTWLTFLILICANLQGYAWLALVDGVVHYAIDWTKTNYTKKEWAERLDESWYDSDDRSEVIRKGLLVKSDWYFYALVLDQALHFATYAVILAVVA